MLIAFMSCHRMIGSSGKGWAEYTCFDEHTCTLEKYHVHVSALARLETAEGAFTARLNLTKLIIPNILIPIGNSYYTGFSGVMH